MMRHLGLIICKWPGVNFAQVFARGPTPNECVDSGNFLRDRLLNNLRRRFPALLNFPFAFSDCYLGRPGDAGDGPDPPGIAPGDGPRIGGPIAGPLD